MFKLLRFCFSLVLLAGFIWFGMSVPLGQHTLFGHAQRIWRAEETQDAVKGTKEAAAPLVDKVRDAVREVGDSH